MKVLVINCGSSSVKYRLVETSARMIETETDRTIVRGSVERIGAAGAVHVLRREGAETRSAPREIVDHGEAIAEILRMLADPERGVLRGADEIGAVGHRMVHGGERFARSVLIDDEVIRGIEECSDLAPLHNPHNLRGYRAAKQVLPGVPHAAVFDTAFHQTMPPTAYLYGLPYDLYTRHAIRRYGFHGTSHRFVAARSRALLGRAPSETRLVTCHLGNGASVCAIDRGRSVDTSMGFTPLEGLLMGSRCGDIDPALPFHLMRKEGLTEEQASSLLNHRSGLHGVSGVSNDMREILEEERRGNERARLAADLFCYRLRKYIGAYAAVLGGMDALIFTGGIGENAAPIRDRSTRGLEFAGIRVDPARNEATVGGREGEISPEGAAVRVLVIPTNEELLIARDAFLLVEGIA